MKKSRSIVLPYLLFSILFIFIGIGLIFIFSYLSQSSDTEASLNESSLPLVIIDPGHGGEDGGAIGTNGCLEKDINLSMAKKLSSVLAGIGIKSILTRNTDTLLYDRNSDFEGRKKYLDMQERLRIVNSHKNVIFVSIHQNAFPQEKYSGFQTYFSPNSKDSAVLAKQIEEGVKSLIQPDNNRSAKSSDGNIYLLDRTECPSVLLECGFLSNSEECESLCSDEYQNKLCQVIGVCIERFILSQRQN